MGFSFYDKPPVAVERRQKRRDRKAIERQVKAEVKRRDGNKCRWPRCEFTTVRQPIDCAHLKAAGMGGDPKSIRMTRDNLMLLCRQHHQGPISLHSGDLCVEPQTSRGTDGPCDFKQLDGRGCWIFVASERSIGVSVMRDEA